MSKKAIILFSGGLDSTTCLAIAKSEGYECYALSFDYGQKHLAELQAAKMIATNLGITEHKVFSLPIGELGGSALTDPSIIIPDQTKSCEIPNTYVPARNTIFLAVALGWAEVIGARDIFLGVSAIDYSHYPDCRPEFIAAFQQLANLGTKVGIKGSHFKIHTPIIHLNKAQTIQKGLSLGVDYKDTISCYRANEAGLACGGCDSCGLRKKGFKELGIKDPTCYI